MRKIAVFCLLLLVAGLCAGERKALLIGNSDYSDLYLHAPANDIRLLGSRLTGLGYCVVLGQDVDRRDFDQLINQFANDLDAENDEVFFYYSGFGAQLKGRNYLLPVGISYDDPDDINYYGLTLNGIIDKLSRGKQLAVFLDASREGIKYQNPQRGLAEVARLPANAFIMFSATTGREEEPGGESNSRFALSLNRHLGTIDLTLQQIHKLVATDLGFEVDSPLSPYFNGNSQLVFNSAIAPSAKETPASPPQPPDQPDDAVDKASPISDLVFPLPPKEDLPSQEVEIFSDVGLSAWQKLNRRNPIDFISGSEFYFSEDIQKNTQHHFISDNLLRLQLFGIGAEGYLKRIYAKRSLASDEYYINEGYQYGVGFGFTNPRLLRLMAHYYRSDLQEERLYHANTIPATTELKQGKVSYQHYGASLEKSISHQTQKMLLKLAYEFTPDEYLIEDFNLGGISLPEFSFDQSVLQWQPKWRFRAELFTTDFKTAEAEPLFMEGLSPSARPTLNTTTNAFILGVKFLLQRNQHSYFLTNSGTSPVEENKLKALVTVLMHANLGRIIGMDVSYAYDEVEDYYLDDNTDPFTHSEFRPSLRITLLDIKPIHLVFTIDYVYHKSSALTISRQHYLNNSFLAVVNFSRGFCLTGFGSYNNDWLLDDTMFTFKNRGWDLGASLGWRF